MSRPMLRALLMVLAVGIAACTQPGDGSSDQAAADGAVETGAPEGIDVPDDPPDWPWEKAARGEEVEQAVSLEEIRSGGPPPDGIPPIDEPQFEPITAAGEWLADQDPVMVVEAGDEVRGYPLAILTFHEIVNDTVGGQNLVVTYCPLCNSGLVFDRELDGETLSFGTSGRLWNSNLVMYDRATRSLWSQFTGEAIIGERTGDALDRLPMQIVAFTEFAERWPDARVLSRDTGHSRPYGDNPYTGYEGGNPFLFDGETGGPLAQMDRVVATGGDADPVAYPWDRLEQERVVHDVVDGQQVVVLWKPGAASALDSREISEGVDVGQAGVFVAEADGQSLTFSPTDDDRFVDEETNSTWTVTGEAVEGPLAGTQLERLNHDDTFWFTQHAFRPDTRVEE